MIDNPPGWWAEKCPTPYEWIYQEDTGCSNYLVPSETKYYPSGTVTYLTQLLGLVPQGISNGDHLAQHDEYYIAIQPDDVINWQAAAEAGIPGADDASAVLITAPCGNPGYLLYETTYEIERTQTWAIRAAIRKDIEKAAAIRAAIAINPSLSDGIKAAIQAQPELDVSLLAAIMGNPEKSLPIRAAIRAERELVPGILAGIGKDIELPVGVKAAVQGNPQVHCHIKAAILGETEITCGIIAYVVNSRADHILLEMENLWPQELDVRSTPNWASVVKDYRKTDLSERNSGGVGR